jgi:hypothetical protein
VEETHFQLQPLDDSDPFEHIRNSPFFSYNRMVYNNTTLRESEIGR